jgi:Polyketide cyclase / dehydrase and lipid transport
VPHIFTSTVIPAPVDQIWGFLRDFARVDVWHPDVTKVTVEGADPGPRVGQERTISLRDGSVMRERLLALDDIQHSYTYSLIKSPLPVSAHSSTVTLVPVTTDDATFVSWSADFAIEGGEQAGLVDGVREQVMIAGFNGMRVRAGANSRRT